MLQENGIKWTSRVITEGGVEVEQVFFHDPDGFMIEICTCEKLPVQPLVASTLVRYLSGKCNNTSNNSLDDLAALSLQLLQGSDPPLQSVMDTISSSNNNCVVCAWINVNEEILYIIHVRYSHLQISQLRVWQRGWWLILTCRYNSSIWSYSVGCKYGRRLNYEYFRLQLCTEWDRNTFKWN